MQLQLLVKPPDALCRRCWQDRAAVVVSSAGCVHLAAVHSWYHALAVACSAVRLLSAVLFPDLLAPGAGFCGL
jgi:hypothetical protein